MVAAKKTQPSEDEQRLGQALVRIAWRVLTDSNEITTLSDDWIEEQLRRQLPQSKAGTWHVGGSEPTTPPKQELTGKPPTGTGGRTRRLRRGTKRQPD